MPKSPTQPERDASKPLTGFAKINAERKAAREAAQAAHDALATALDDDLEQLKDASDADRAPLIEAKERLERQSSMFDGVEPSFVHGILYRFAIPHAYDPKFKLVLDIADASSVFEARDAAAAQAERMALPEYCVEWITDPRHEPLVVRDTTEVTLAYDAALSTNADLMARADLVDAAHANLIGRGIDPANINAWCVQLNAEIDAIHAAHDAKHERNVQMLATATERALTSLQEAFHASGLAPRPPALPPAPDYTPLIILAPDGVTVSDGKARYPELSAASWSERPPSVDSDMLAQGARDLDRLMQDGTNMLGFSLAQLASLKAFRAHILANTGL